MMRYKVWYSCCDNFQWMNSLMLTAFWSVCCVRPGHSPVWELVEYFLLPSGSDRLSVYWVGYSSDTNGGTYGTLHMFTWATYVTCCPAIVSGVSQQRCNLNPHGCTGAAGVLLVFYWINDQGQDVSIVSTPWMSHFSAIVADVKKWVVTVRPDGDTLIAKS